MTITINVCFGTVTNPMVDRVIGLVLYLPEGLDILHALEYELIRNNYPRYFDVH